MNLQRPALSFAAALAGIAMGACHDQQTIEGTSSRTINVAGKRIKANLSPTGTPNEFDLLIVRDAVVIDPDPASERARRGSRGPRHQGSLQGQEPQPADR